MGSPAVLAARVALAAVLALPFLAVAAAAEDQPPNFHAAYDGTFSISFGTGAGGTNELSFAGSGLARHLGTSTVEGASLLAQIDALCTEIAEDAVTLTAADGAELFLVNVGTECLNPSTFTIEGAGTGEVVGGTGRFEGATGTLTWEVTAPVTAIAGNVASGTFHLEWQGSLSS